MRWTWLVPACLVSLSSCADDLPTDTIERAFRAASLSDASTPVIMAMAVSGRDAPDGCPRISTAGATSIAAGGCTTASGPWTGTLVTDNVPSIAGTNTAVDLDRPRRLDIAVATVDTRIEGEVGWDPNTGKIEVALTEVIDGVTSVLDLRLSCDRDRSCTPHDSTLELDGLGVMDIEGSWVLDEPSRGTLILRGADTISFDLATSRFGCVQFRVAGGSRGEVCAGTNQHYVFLERSPTL